MNPNINPDNNNNNILSFIIFSKDMKKIVRRPHDRIQPSHDYLKYWRIIRYWAKKQYGFTVADLDIMFFLYSERLFTKTHFHKYGEIMSWDPTRFKSLIERGYIHIWREKQGKEARLYEVTFKGKRAINNIYKKLNGEEIAESAVINPIFKDDVRYMDKVYRNAILELNKSIKQQQRPSLE